MWFWKHQPRGKLLGFKIEDVTTKTIVASFHDKLTKIPLVLPYEAVQVSETLQMESQKKKG